MGDGLLAGDCRFRELPEVRLPGLRATRLVLLRQVGHLIAGERTQVLRAGIHPLQTLGEERTDLDLVIGYRGAAVVRIRVADVQTGATLFGGLCLAVSTDEVRATLVTIFLARFRQTTFYGVDTGSISYLCHSK